MLSYFLINFQLIFQFFIEMIYSANLVKFFLDNNFQHAILSYSLPTRPIIEAIWALASDSIKWRDPLPLTVNHELLPKDGAIIRKIGFLPVCEEELWFERIRKTLQYGYLGTQTKKNEKNKFLSIQIAFNRLSTISFICIVIVKVYTTWVECFPR